MNEANLTLDGTATESLGQLAAFKAATLTVTAGTAVLGGLTDADGFQLPRERWCDAVTLSVLPSYAGPVNSYVDVIEATGAGSKLSLPAAATLTGGRDAIQLLDSEFRHCRAAMWSYRRR